MSTDDQDLSLQIDAIMRHGIPKTAIFLDKMSGAKSVRSGLASAWKCSRAATSSSCGDWTAILCHDDTAFGATPITYAGDRAPMPDPIAVCSSRMTTRSRKEITCCPIS
ncbi:MAG: hypothetical protein ACYC4B_31430 [Pirellulaceae bacterium]